jgi:hypothetical protein
MGHQFHLLLVMQSILLNGQQQTELSIHPMNEHCLVGWHPVVAEETFYSFVNGSRATPSKVTDWTSDYWFSSERHHNREASTASHQPITFREASTLYKKTTFDSA